MNHTQPIRTIAVTYRRRARFARIKLQQLPEPRGRDRLVLRQPESQRRAYDADLAMELIANTCELPTRKRDLIIVLAHYRYALHDLAAQARDLRPSATHNGTSNQGAHFPHSGHI